MTGFVSRTISLILLFSISLFGLLFLLWGQVNEEIWQPLWKDFYLELPLGAILAIGIITLSLFISLWMTILMKSREVQITRHVKGLIEPDFQIPKNQSLPGGFKKALTQTNELIETQRKSLQRMTNERIETHDKVIQERIIAERQRLARELHDSVSQQLFAASMLLSALNESAHETAISPKSLQQVEKIVQQAQLEMRALLLHLRPVALHNKTLAQGLQELISELQEKVYFEIHCKLEEIKLSKAEEDHLFRIAQEALSNTLRHAKATDLELLFIARDNLAILRIQDNGLGFDIEADKSASYGLQNIAERAIEIGCMYKIVSIPGEGTIVEVKVPLNREEEIIS